MSKYVENSDWHIASQHTDDIVSRVILFRMLMLQRQVADVRLDDGPNYFVRAYSYWITSLAISEYQLKKALDKLRGSGAIETKVKRYAGNRTLHLRVPEVITRPKSEQSTDPSVSNHPTYPLAIDGSYKMEDILEDKMEGKEDFAFLSPKSASEAVASDVSMEDKIISGAPTFAALRKIWSIRWHQTQDGPVDGLPGSPKVQKMWKQFIAKSEEHNQKPLQLIAHALEDWGAFRSRIKEATGMGSPIYPNIGVIFGSFPTLLKMGKDDTEVADFEFAEGESPTDKFMAKFNAEQNGGD